MQCPDCGEENLPDDALFCSSCGFKIEEATEEEKKYSKAQPIICLAILNALTFNAYSSWWFFRKSAQLKEAGMAVRPFWRLVGIGIPIASIYCAYLMFRDTKKLATNNGLSSPYGSLFIPTAVYSVTAIIYAVFFLNPGGPAGAIISLIALAVMTYLMSLAQMNLNAYWSKAEPDLPTKSFAKLEGVVAVAGGIVMLGFLLQIISYTFW